MSTFAEQAPVRVLSARRLPIGRDLPRYAIATACVVALHAAGLWALRNGLLTRPAEIVVPVQLLATLVDAPAPLAAELTRPAPVPASPPPAPAKPAPKPVRPAKAAPVRKPQPAPAPQTPTAVAQPAPAPVDPAPPAMASNATPATNTSAGAAPSTAPPAATDTAARAAAPAAAAAAVSPSPPRAPAALELPSSDAQYLQNPKPRYPPVSLRSGEQGTVLIEVLVGDTGRAQDARIKTSSGFFRLDNAALSTVLTWRFVPGKRAGVAQTMWFTVPITFGLR